VFKTGINAVSFFACFSSCILGVFRFQSSGDSSTRAPLA